MQSQVIETKKVIFKNCPPLTSCVKKINNTQIDGPQDIYVVMLAIT